MANSTHIVHSPSNFVIFTKPKFCIEKISYDTGELGASKKLIADHTLVRTAKVLLQKHLKLCKLNEIVQNQVNSGKFGGNLPPQASANQQKSRWHLFEKQI